MRRKGRKKGKDPAEEICRKLRKERIVRDCDQARTLLQGTGMDWGLVGSTRVDWYCWGEGTEGLASGY